MSWAHKPQWVVSDFHTPQLLDGYKLTVRDFKPPTYYRYLPHQIKVVYGVRLSIKHDYVPLTYKCVCIYFSGLQNIRSFGFYSVTNNSLSLTTVWCIKFSNRFSNSMYLFETKISQRFIQLYNFTLELPSPLAAFSSSCTPDS